MTPAEAPPRTRAAGRRMWPGGHTGAGAGERVSHEGALDDE